ncbi:MAG: tRNA (adenine-N1)-methyltransferase [Actinomycetota bacterium]
MSDNPAILRHGDIVQLTDPKGRHHTLTLEAGRSFHTHKGALAHDDIIGRPEGIVLSSTGGTAYVVLRSLLEDYVLAMPRGAAVIYPKESARIVMAAGLRPGASVIEAGAGSGALSCSLLTAVGPSGRVVSCERRPDFAAVARANVERWFHTMPSWWELLEGDVDEVSAGLEGFDAMVLDLLDPWEHLATAARLVRPGGVLVCYVATTTQLSRTAEALRDSANWTEPRAEESLVRTWHLEGLAVRPDHRMIGHTAFLLIARRLAPGTVLPPRRTRPAKGARPDGDGYAAPPKSQ